MKPYGLVLSGGQSSRMGQDKGSLIYQAEGVDQRTHCYHLLSELCDQVFVSIRSTQENLIANSLPTLVDQTFGPGPGNGILSADHFHPGHAWLVLACDFPFVDLATLKALTVSRTPDKKACAYVDSEGFIEPFLTLWEPPAILALRNDFQNSNFSPRKTLEHLDITRLISPNAKALLNVNSPFHSSHSVD